MKKLSITLSTLFLLLIAFTACNYNDLIIEQSEQEVITELRSIVPETTHYYWFEGERIAISVNMDYVHVIMNDEFRESADLSSVFQTLNIEQDNSVQVDGMVKLRLQPEGARTRSMSALSDYENMVETLKQSGAISYVFPFFERGGGAPPIGTSDVFYVKLKEENDFARLKEVAGRHNVQIVEQFSHMPLWYILSVQGSGFRNSIEASNYFFETDYFYEIDPAFMFNFTPNCVGNHLWGLRNPRQFNGVNIDINVCNAWAITRGLSVNVAVIDTGIDVNHPDLRNRFHPLSRDAQFNRSPSAPPPGPTHLRYHHGTHVAGIIAGTGSSGEFGIVGVAPESQIIRISHNGMHDDNRNLSAQLANGINWAWQNGAHVINNSWGDYGGRFESQFRTAALNNAIRDAITRGRGGLGTVVVFASGNNGLSNRIDYPGCVHPDIIVVGAINSSGDRWGMSNRGRYLDVVAPGQEIESTMPNNRTDRRSGTSMAAPHVAGVAALMLSANPNLTAREVREIINRTANRNLPQFTVHENRPHGTWNRDLGHGLVDAFAAVLGASIHIFNPLSTICPGAADVTFSLRNAPMDVTTRWTVDPPLSIVANNHHVVIVRHSGASAPANSRVKAEVSLNGRVISTLQRDLVVNRPTIQSIQVPSAIHAGVSLLFTVNHSGGTVAWSVFPNQGVAMNSWGNTLNIGFPSPGSYTVTATVTNACGTSTMNRNIMVISPPAICAYCGTPTGFPPGCPRCPSLIVLPCPLSDPTASVEVEQKGQSFTPN